MRDRLIELIKEGEDRTPCAFDPEYDCEDKKCGDCVREAIADHLLANGVIVTPVSVGQTVWFFSGVLEEVCEAKVVRIAVNFYTNPMLWFEFEYFSKLIGTQVINGRIDLFLGNTVFLTKEEAEKALAERSGK